MKNALVLVILVGTAIGAMMPSAPPEAEAAEEPSPPLSNAQPSTRQPGETLIERRDDGHFYVHAEVNGELVRFMVDTGATPVALTVDDARRLRLPVSEGAFTVIGTGASGPVRGQQVMLDRIAVDGKEARQVRGAVIEGLTISLLGQAYLSRLSSVKMSGDYMTLQ